jgi:hypothetical protein
MATVTAQTIIYDALYKLGVVAPGDPVSDANAEQGLNTLNTMLDSWSNESLVCFATLEQSAPLVVGQSAYTIGTGGNFNMTRPLNILDGWGSCYAQDTLGNNYPIQVLQRASWNLIGNRSSIVTSNVPTQLFYDPQYPLGVINVFPTPNVGGYTLFWDSTAQLTDFSSLTATFSMPPGYQKALQDNLAVELAPYFSDGQINPLIMLAASKSKAAIKRTNTRPEAARFDPAITARGNASYNIYQDRGY